MPPSSVNVPLDRLACRRPAPRWPPRPRDRGDVEGERLRGADVRLPEPAEQDAQHRVGVGGGADRRADVGAHPFLVDDDRGRQPIQDVDVGPRQRRHEALDEGAVRLVDQPLRLRGDRAEHQRALARAGDAGEHREPPLRDLEADVLEVVHARALHTDQVVAIRALQRWGRCVGGGGRAHRAHIVYAGPPRGLRSRRASRSVDSGTASGLIESPGEEDRVPVVRALVRLAVFAGAIGGRRPHPVDRARRGRRGPGRGRRLLPGPPLRPAAGVAVPVAGGDRRPNQADRDRHRGHRHALREPAVHGRGRGCGRPDRRWSPPARDQPGLAGAGHRWLPVLRLRAARGRDGRRHGPPSTPRSSSRPSRAPGSPSPTRGRCSRTRPACFAPSRIRPGCGTASGGAPDHAQRRNGPGSRA